MYCQRLLGLALALVMVGSVIVPAMAMPTKEGYKTLPKGRIKKIWDEWTHKEDEIRALWSLDTHRLIAEEVGRAMGLYSIYLSIFKDYSVAPDSEDQYLDRLYKHVYDPMLNWGGAPEACEEKFEDALLYSHISLETVYKELGRASHYLMDVGNPYHSSLWPVDKARHDLYERTVHEKLSNNDEWNLRQIAYNAPKITVTDPAQAVKELADISNDYRSELDETMAGGLFGLTVVDEEKMKQITQELVKYTAGYVKGLLEYYDKRAYGIRI